MMHAGAIVAAIVAAGIAVVVAGSLITTGIRRAGMFISGLGGGTTQAIATTTVPTIITTHTGIRVIHLRTTMGTTMPGMGTDIIRIMTITGMVMGDGVMGSRTEISRIARGISRAKDHPIMRTRIG
jgi:hypothetical protein